MATAARHGELSDTLLQQAEAEFERGDLLQASEKAWGAFAHYVKSVARERGWRNRSHTDLWDIAQELIPYTDDPARYGTLFRSVNGMHTNFYEEYLHSSGVRGGIDDAMALIDALRRAEPDFPMERPQWQAADRAQ